MTRTELAKLMTGEEPSELSSPPAEGAIRIAPPGEPVMQQVFRGGVWRPYNPFAPQARSVTKLHLTH